jgi:hypothetical protein
MSALRTFGPNNKLADFLANEGLEDANVWSSSVGDFERNIA